MVNGFKKIFSLFLFVLVCVFFGKQAQACTNLTVSFSTSSTGCGIPKAISITNLSTGSLAATTSYIWKVNNTRFDSTFGNSTPTGFTALTPGTYVFKVLARTPGGCWDSSFTASVIVTSFAKRVFNGFNVATFTPVWNNCIINPVAPNSFTLNLSSPDTLNTYTIIWGDGGPNSSGAQLLPGNIETHTYTTLGNIPIKIVTVNNGCTDTLLGTVFNLRPVSSSIRPLSPGQLAGCAPHSITFTDSTVYAFPGTVITWNFGDGTIITRNWTQANTPISHTYPSVGNGNCVFTVSLSTFNPNCNTGNSSTYSISPILIFDKDIADIGTPTNLCNPNLTYTLNNTSANNCITGQRYYYWDFGDGTNTGWITSKGAQTHTFPTIGTYTIMLIDSNGCGSDTDYATITINKPPIAGFNMTPKFGCAPLLVSFVDTSSGAGLTRNWTLVGTTPTTSTAASFTRTFNNPGTFVATLRVSNVCATNVTVRDTVRVYAKPVVSIANALPGCVPHTVQLQNNTVNISPQAKFLWRFANGDTSTLRTPPVLNFNTPGAYTVKLIVTDTCGTDSTSTVINVSTKPIASFTAPTVCRGDSSVFTSTSTLALGDIVTSYRWYFGDGDSSSLASPKHLYATADTFQVILKITSDKSCVDFDTMSVIVKASPNVSFVSTPASVCLGTVVNFNGTATTADGVITGYYWTFGSTILDSAKVEDTAYLYPSAGTYNATFTAYNSTGCFFTYRQNVVVNPIPDSRFLAVNACQGQKTRFIDSSTVTNANTITQWAWDFNNDGITDSTTQNPTFVFNSANNFKVKLTVGSNNNCYNTDSVLVNVNAIPTVQIAASSNSLCKRDSLTLTNTSIGAIHYIWKFGDGTADLLTDSTTGFKKAYADTGLYVVKMTAISTNGCKDSATLNINSRPFPIARFTVNDTISCAPKVFTFTNQSQLADNYTWMVNGLSNSILTNKPDTQVSLPNQTVEIKLIAKNIYGCRQDTVTRTLKTLANPLPDFLLSSDSGCAPLNVVFSNVSANSTSYMWNISNGLTNTDSNTFSTFVASATNDTTYYAKLIAFNGPGCKDSIVKPIKVYPKPISNFTVSDSANCGPLAVNFTNTSVHKFGGTINDFSFDWNFNNGQQSAQKDPNQTFTASGIIDTNYLVKLIATTKYGCKDTAAKNIRVYPNPKSKFAVTTNNGCAPLAVNFLNQSYPNDTGSISIMNFNWRFANGLTSTSLNPASTFIANPTKDTIYNTRLIAYSEHGCRDTAYQDIRIYPKPLSSFTVSDTAGCGPLSVLFSNASLPYDTGSINDMTFRWDIGNGFISISKNPSAQYFAAPLIDTVYRVQLIAVSEHACKDTSVKTVRVHPKPIASFTVNKTQGCGPLLVNFTNTSQISTKHRWIFGDGDSSSATSVAHTYQSYDLFDSIYDVTLNTESLYGCKSDTPSRSIIARYNPIADFTTSVDSLCGSGTIAFFNLSSGGVGNNWTFGNGTTSTAYNPVKNYTGLPIKDTSYTIKLVVTTPYACKDSVERTIKVNPLPDANFIPISNACTPIKANFNGITSLRAVKYEWDFGDGTNDTVMSSSKLFENTTPLINRSFPVVLKVYSASGCTDTAKQTVTVFPKPVANFSISKTNRCDTAEFKVLNSTLGATSNYRWSYGDGVLESGLFNPSHIFPTRTTIDTNYDVTLIAQSINTCFDTAVRNVLIKPLVIASFTTATTSSCSNLNVQMANTSRNDVNWFWTFGDGAGSQLRNPTHVYTNPGTYKVSLISYDAYGCSDTVEKSNYINVYEMPTANFLASPQPINLPNTTVNFSNISFLSAGTLTYRWNFGHIGSGDNTSALKDPLHTYADSGNYTVQLIATSDQNCIDTIENIIRISPHIPAADFTFDLAQGCSPLTVQFTNKSNYARSYQWSFGDAFSDTSANPQHTYTFPGVYSVFLRAIGEGGVDDTIMANIITVHPAPKANFNASPLTLYLPDALLSLLNTSFDVVKSKWTIFDENNAVLFTDTNLNSEYLFNSAASFSVKLVVMNAFGCLDSLTKLNAIKVGEGGSIVVPTAFTPNADSKNDVFIPLTTGVLYGDYSFRIYDRWGQRVFETANLKEGWDGTIRGGEATIDTYVWVVEGRYIGGKQFSKNGQFTLLR